MGRDTSLNSQRGFSLVELMAAMLVLVVGMLGVLTMVNGANKRITENRAREAATNLAREVVEGARAVPYPDVTAASLATLLQAQPGLGDESVAAGWNVERRGATYTIQVRSCVMDESSDGVGDHTGSADTYCSDSPSGVTTPADLNPDDYKRISVTVTHAGGQVPTTVKQTAIINNPGSAFAPSVRSLTANGMTPPYRVTSASTAAITFTANITPRATYVPWTVDNVVQGNAAGPTIDNWSFIWPVGPTVPDGVYLIGAKGFNAQDQTGSAKAVSVTLNRYPPQLPASLSAGRNGTVGIEFDWTASTDRDVTAYRVYRMTGSQPAVTDSLVCTKSVSDANPLSCIIGDLGGDHRYYVVAVAPACCNGTGQQESTRPTASETVLVTDNVAPNPPQDVGATRVNGVVNLTWSAPASPAGGEPSDSIAFYRIYRDGQAVADRYGRADGDATSFIDADPAQTAHTYWITAVDTHMRESEPVGGLTL
jgi:prepilin-type N-terminal cleavage/methylation domain-containing protein